jgi:hypothetical protein
MALNLMMKPANMHRRQLSDRALSALKEFYNEQDEREKLFEDLKASTEEDYGIPKALDMESFSEDWNASQFWVCGDCPKLQSIAY